MRACGSAPAPRFGAASFLFPRPADSVTQGVFSFRSVPLLSNAANRQDSDAPDEQVLRGAREERRQKSRPLPENRANSISSKKSNARPPDASTATRPTRAAMSRSTPQRQHASPLQPSSVRPELEVGRADVCESLARDTNIRQISLLSCAVQPPRAPTWAILIPLILLGMISSPIRLCTGAI